MLGPVAGQIMTSLLNGEKPFIDPNIMDYHRFERGEKNYRAERRLVTPKLPTSNKNGTAFRGGLIFYLLLKSQTDYISKLL